MSSNLVFPDVSELNDKYYDNKLMYLSDLDLIVQEYNDSKSDLKLKKADLMADIPAVWSHKDIFEDIMGVDHIYKPVMAKTPNWVVYLYVYATPQLFPPYKMGGKFFYNAPMYVGKGTINRVCSHGQSKGTDTTIPATTLREYNLDFRAKGLEPFVLILAKELDETRAKWLEADVINCLQAKAHYTRGEEGFRMAPRLLNARKETANAGYLMKTDGTFGESDSRDI